MDCLFCKIVNKEIPSYTLYEDDKVIVFLDINPVCDGHALVVPKKHFTDVFEVDENTLKYMYSIGEKIIELEKEKLRITGCQMVINYMDKQVIKHVHLHIVPDLDKHASQTVEEVYKKLGML